MQIDIDHLYSVINELNQRISDQSMQLQILKFKVESNESEIKNEAPIIRKSIQNQKSSQMNQISHTTF